MHLFILTIFFTISMKIFDDFDDFSLIFDDFMFYLSGNYVHTLVHSSFKCTIGNSIFFHNSAFVVYKQRRQQKQQQLQEQ